LIFHNQKLEVQTHTSADGNTRSISQLQITEQNCLNAGIIILNKWWFKANKLSLNFDETNCIKLSIHNRTCFDLNIWYNNKKLAGTTKLLLTKRV
jgi:hypothetical protein